MYGTRECAKVRDDKEKLSTVVQELLLILLCSTSIVYLAYIGFILCIPRTREQLPLMFIASVMLWLYNFGAEWFYRSIEQYEYITVRNIAFKLLALVLMFIFVRQTGDYLAYAVINIIGSAGSNVLNMLRIRSFITFSRRYKMDLRHHIGNIFANRHNAATRLLLAHHNRRCVRPRGRLAARVLFRESFMMSMLHRDRG